ncbi:hypothetical protein GRJ2_000620100 [Grus japonensis]|uniref:Uncharacterized protein n=1 Tax=Grus japonensis TaxID=30415 RepID=A0ABC9W7N7_GRUJA
MEKIMVRQAVPLQPREVHGGADIHLQPVEDPTPESVDAPKGGCDPVGSPRWSNLLAGPVALWKEEPTLEQLPGEGILNPSNSYQFDVNAGNRCPELGKGSQVSRRAPEVQHKVIPATPANQSASSGAQLKCLYANDHNMGNKEEELETCACLQDCDLIGITEMWWDGSYDWSVGMEGHRLFRKDRQGRRGEGVTLYVNDQLECMELCLEKALGRPYSSLLVPEGAYKKAGETLFTKAWSDRTRANGFKLKEGRFT